MKYQVPMRIKQWFPTGGSRTPRGPKQDFWGSELRFTTVRVCMFLDARTEICERTEMLLLKRLSSLIILTDVINLTI